MWPGFTTVAMDKSATLRYIKSFSESLDVEEKTRALFEITGEVCGYQIFKTSDNPAESDVIIEPETRFKVVSAIREADVYTHITVCVEKQEPILKDVINNFAAACSLPPVEQKKTMLISTTKCDGGV